MKSALAFSFNKVEQTALAHVVGGWFENLRVADFFRNVHFHGQVRDVNYSVGPVFVVAEGTCLHTERGFVFKHSLLQSRGHCIVRVLGYVEGSGGTFLFLCRPCLQLTSSIWQEVDEAVPLLAPHRKFEGYVPYVRDDSGRCCIAFFTPSECSFPGRPVSPIDTQRYRHRYRYRHRERCRHRHRHRYRSQYRYR